MNTDRANDPELREFGRWIDRVAPVTTPDLDAAWEDLAKRLERDRSRRTALGVTAAVVVLVLVAGGVLVELTRRAGEQGLGSNDQQLQTGPVVEPLTEPVSDAAPASVRALLRMPTCADSGDLTAWADEAMGEWGVSLVDSDWTSVPVSDVLSRAPMPRDSAAACVTAIESANSTTDVDVAAYLLQSADGTVLARMVSAPHATNVVPPEIVNAKPNKYHQETVGSGQQFNGYLEAGVGVGITGTVDARRLVVLDLAPLYPADGEEHANNSALLSRLTFDRVLESKFGTSNLPTCVPFGYGRCGGLQGLFDVYCNEGDQEITLQQTADVTEAVAGETLERPGFTLRRLPSSVDRQRWRIDQGTAVRGVVEAPAAVDPEALAQMVGSIPLLDPRLLDPASGHGEMQAIATPDWLIARLEMLGGTDTQVQGSVGPTAAVDTTFVVDERAASLNVYPVVDRGGGAAFLEGIMDRPFEIVRVGAVDMVHVTWSVGGFAGMNQVFFHCGGLEWNFLAQTWPAEDARSFATDLAGSLPCNQ